MLLLLMMTMMMRMRMMKMLPMLTFSLQKPDWQLHRSKGIDLGCFDSFRLCLEICRNMQVFQICKKNVQSLKDAKQCRIIFTMLLIELVTL